jgi:hypothetical protein
MRSDTGVSYAATVQAVAGVGFVDPLDAQGLRFVDRVGGLV